MRSSSVFFTIVCAIAILVFSASTAYAQDPTSEESDYVMVSGTVTDAFGGYLLPGVSVGLKGQPMNAQTDRAGRYGIAVPREELDSATLVFSLFNYSIFETRIAGRQDVSVALNRLPALEGRQSDIHFNAFACLPAFGEFDASCADYFTLELRWLPKYNRAPGHWDHARLGRLGGMPLMSSLMMADDNQNGRQGIGGGVSLAGDRGNSIPPPPEFAQQTQSADFSKVRDRISSSQAAVSDSIDVDTGGFYSLMAQVIKPLPSPIDSRFLSINAFLAAGFSWILEGDPSGSNPGIEGKFGIPTFGYGAEMVVPFSLGNVNLSARVQLQGIVYYPGELNYIYRVDSPNTTEGFVDITVPKEVQSHRKLNLLVGVGVVLAD